jgi:hypothetical protein
LILSKTMSLSPTQDVFMGSPGLHHREQSAPSTPLPLVSPGFLQPRHQPRLIVPLWNPIQFAQQEDHSQQATINPELLRGSRSKSLSQQLALCRTTQSYPHYWPIWALQYCLVVSDKALDYSSLTCVLLTTTSLNVHGISRYTYPASGVPTGYAQWLRKPQHVSANVLT